ncbi:hypothetical protein IW261DRAFT_1648220, partial [Armillaria novae-zelandiae]
QTLNKNTLLATEKHVPGPGAIHVTVVTECALMCFIGNGIVGITVPTIGALAWPRLPSRDRAHPRVIPRDLTFKSSKTIHNRTVWKPKELQKGKPRRINYLTRITSGTSVSLSDGPKTRTAARPSTLRRTKSLDDLEMHTVRFANQDDKKEKLTKEQVKTVQAAEQSMTAEQRDILQKHRNSLTKEKGREHPPSPSPTPGPSSAIAKGKFVDHNLEIDDSKLDPEAQREALETWNQVHDINEEVEAHSSDPEHGFQAVKKKHQKSKGKEDVAVKSKSKQQKHNRFEVLEVEETSDDDNSDEVESTVKPRSHHKSKKPSSKREKKIRHVAEESDRRIKNIVRVHSQGASSSHHGSRQGSIRPVDQLPCDSFLADILEP